MLKTEGKPPQSGLVRGNVRTCHLLHTYSVFLLSLLCLASKSCKTKHSYSAHSFGNTKKLNFFNKVNKTQAKTTFQVILTLILLAGKKKELSFSNF